MYAQNASGRATWTRPVFHSQDGAPGTAQHVNSITLSHKSDVRYIARVHGIVHAGVADSTGARDAHGLPRTTE
jgi:hypothetical protein